MHNIREKVKDGILNLDTMPLGKVQALWDQGSDDDRDYIAGYLHDRMCGLFSNFMQGKHDKADVARIYSDIEFEKQTREAAHA